MYSVLRKIPKLEKLQLEQFDSLHQGQTRDKQPFSDSLHNSVTNYLNHNYTESATGFPAIFYFFSSVSAPCITMSTDNSKAAQSL